MMWVSAGKQAVTFDEKGQVMSVKYGAVFEDYDGYGVVMKLKRGYAELGTEQAEVPVLEVKDLKRYDDAVLVFRNADGVRIGSITLDAKPLRDALAALHFVTT